MTGNPPESEDAMALPTNEGAASDYRDGEEGRAAAAGRGGCGAQHGGGGGNRSVSGGVRSQAPSESADDAVRRPPPFELGSPIPERDNDGDGDGGGGGSGGGRGRGGGGGGGSLGGGSPSRPRGNVFCRVLHRLDHARVLCGHFVNDKRVQLFVVALIFVNAVTMGIATFDFVSDDPAIEEKFEATDQIFLIIFTAELGLQFLYHGLRLFLDGWLLFDFVVIVVSWAFSSAQIIRSFRIFRALRLVTHVKVLRNLVVALFSVLPNMAAISTLLFLIMYIFAVMFTQLFKDMYEDDLTEYDYFSSLDGTFFTLFQIMTFDAWADVAREVMVTYSWAWLPFIIFVIISGFVIVNLIIAVICDAIATLHEDALAKLHGRAVDGTDSTEEERGEEGEIVSSNGEQVNRRSGSGLVLSAEEVQRRVEVMEGQIKESTKIQEQTALTIEYLIQELQKIPTPDR